MAERTKWLAIGATACALTTLLGATLGIFFTSGAKTSPLPTEVQTITTTVTDTAIREASQVEILGEPQSVLQIRRQGIHTAAGAGGSNPLNEGNVVTVVDEQATLILQGAFPLYRQLALGTTGQDVAQIRAALVRLKLLDEPTGASLDRKMADALLALFAKSGYPLRDTNGIPATAESLVLAPNRLAMLGSLPATSDKACGELGAVAAEVVCTLRSEQARLVIELPRTQAASPKHRVEVSLKDGRVVESSVGAALPASGETTRYLLEFKEGQQPTPSDVARATLIRQESPPGTLSVSASALRDVTGSKAKLQFADKSLHEVTIGFCAEGRCVVAGDGLKPGIEVLVA